MSAIASKRFSDEFASLLDKSVRVYLSSGVWFEGRVSAYNPSDYSLWLADVRDEKGRQIPKLFVSGGSIVTIEVVEAGPDLGRLAERLEKVFPNMVRYVKEAGVILVMDRVRVTKDGVVEGRGPVADRVQKIYEEWIQEEKA